MSMTTNGDSPSRAAQALESLGDHSPGFREAVFWALAAARARDWAYALKWLDLADQQAASAPRTMSRIRSEWSRELAAAPQPRE
jgi:phytoene/squalene synthetase